MESQVRVWVSGDTDRALPIVRGLISQQIDARSGLDEIADLGEAGAIRPGVPRGGGLSGPRRR
ncbi:hypothetical protein V8Z69_17955, partial [Microbacterium aurugineum]|uniref:hypothetical protein n=1 Tax=Microbacterium aurugineum TaxID=2851642 RepID=UPI0039BE1AEC